MGKQECESEKVFKADLVAHGAGRIPNVENLKLENADINYQKYRTKVNQYLQSISNKNVYVAGDAHAEGIQLTPAAEMERKIAAYNMLHGNAMIPDYTAIPSVVFTHPGLAASGSAQLTLLYFHLLFPSYLLSYNTLSYSVFLIMA